MQLFSACQASIPVTITSNHLINKYCLLKNQTSHPPTSHTPTALWSVCSSVQHVCSCLNLLINSQVRLCLTCSSFTTWTSVYEYYFITVAWLKPLNAVHCIRIKKGGITFFLKASKTCRIWLQDLDDGSHTILSPLSRKQSSVHMALVPLLIHQPLLFFNLSAP